MLYVTCRPNQTCLPSSRSRESWRWTQPARVGACADGSVRRVRRKSYVSATEIAKTQLHSFSPPCIHPASLRLPSLHRTPNGNIARHAHEEVLRPSPRVSRRRSGPKRGRGDAAGAEEAHIRHNERPRGSWAHIEGLEEPHTLEVSRGGRGKGTQRA